MSRASRRMRRAAARRAHQDGFYVEVPAGTNLAAWEASIRGNPSLSEDDRTVGLAIAKFLRGES